MHNKILNKILDGLHFFSSCFFILILLIILIGSLSYWTEYFPYNAPFIDKAFYCAILIAITTSIAQWIEGRLRFILKIKRRK